MTAFNKKAGCRPTYQIPETNLPICSGRQETKRAYFRENRFYFKEDISADPPCEEMVYISYNYDEIVETGSGIEFEIIYPNRIKLNQQSREISFHALIGNCGGYIGLFLGKPGLNFALCNFIKDWNILYCPVNLM